VANGGGSIRPLQFFDRVNVACYVTNRSTNNNTILYRRLTNLPSSRYQLTIGDALIAEMSECLEADGIPEDDVRISRVAMRMKALPSNTSKPLQFKNVNPKETTVAVFINDSIDATPESNNNDCDSSKLANDISSGSESEDEYSTSRTFDLDILLQIPKPHLVVATSNTVGGITVKLLRDCCVEANGKTLAVTDGKNAESKTHFKVADYFGSDDDLTECKSLSHSMVQAAIGCAYTKSNPGKLLKPNFVFALQNRVAQKTAYTPFLIIGNSNVPQDNNKLPCWMRRTDSEEKDEITLTATIAQEKERVTVENGGLPAKNWEEKLKQTFRTKFGCDNDYDFNDEGLSSTSNYNDDNDDDDSDNDDNNNNNLSSLVTVEGSSSKSKRAKSQSSALDTQASILSLYKDSDSRNPLYHGFSRKHLSLLILALSAHNFKPGDYSFVPLLESSNFTPGSLPDLGRDRPRPRSLPTGWCK